MEYNRGKNDNIKFMQTVAWSDIDNRLLSLYLTKDGNKKTGFDYPVFLNDKTTWYIYSGTAHPSQNKEGEISSKLPSR
jgi:hypothetical protein